MSGVHYPHRDLFAEAMRRWPLGPRLLSLPRGRPGRGGGAFHCVGVRLTDDARIAGVDLMRVNADRREEVRPIGIFTFEPHDCPQLAEVWRRPWHGRVRRFLTGWC